MKIKQLDHLVLTVTDLQSTISFYTEILGMEQIRFGGHRQALRFGNQKINLHLADHEFEPKADKPSPGSADLCFVVETPIDEVCKELNFKGIEILEGPVQRTGASSAILSVYIRDPDGNLIELANPIVC